MFASVPNTFSDPYLTFAFAAGITAVALTTLLILVIVFLRLRLRKHTHHEEAFVALWRPLLLEAVSVPEPVVHPALPARDQIHFLKLWNYLQESLRGPANDRLNELALNLECDAAARNFLRKGHRAERLLAILTLGHLRDPAAWDDLIRQAQGADAVASIHAARALTRIDPLRATEYLLPVLLERTDWDITQVAAFLGEARQAFWLRLAKNILTIDPQHWARALQLAEALNLQLPHASMLHVLKNSPSADTLAAALHMASGPALATTVRCYLGHGDWRVRVEAARFLSRFGDAGDIPALQSLLQDAQWWVRYQAAQSLAAMPFFGPAQLRLLRAQSQDAQVAEMLDQVLAEEDMARGRG